MVVDTLGNILILMAPVVGLTGSLILFFFVNRWKDQGQELVTECEIWLRERTKR